MAKEPSRATGVGVGRMVVKQMSRSFLGDLEIVFENV